MSMHGAFGRRVVRFFKTSISSRKLGYNVDLQSYNIHSCTNLNQVNYNWQQIVNTTYCCNICATTIKQPSYEHDENNWQVL